MKALSIWLTSALLAGGSLCASGWRALRVAPAAVSRCETVVTRPASLQKSAVEKNEHQDVVTAAEPVRESLAALEAALPQAPQAELQKLMRSMLDFGGEDAARALIRSTHALRTAQSALAWELLGKLDNEAARGFMLLELEGPNSGRACAYFKDFVDVRALESLERAAREHGPAVGDAVAALVAQGAPALPSLVRLLATEDAAAAVIANAASVLALRPALRASCIARLSNGGGEHGCLEYLQHDTSAAARNALLALANDENLARSAAEALAARGDADSNAALRSLQQGDRPWAACEARHALVESADSRSRSALSTLVENGATGEVLRSLLELAAPEGTRALLALARHENPVRRVQAAGLLAGYGPPDKERLLRGLADDPDPYVGSVARNALRSLGIELP